jgi:hypothetical protein
MWLRQAKRLLNRNDKAKKMCDSIQVTSRQPRNLQRIVAGNSTVVGGNTPPSNPGCFKCQKKCKVSCPILQEGQKFQSTNTQKVYTIQKRLDCDSSFVIYLGTCNKCKGQYVGKSQTSFKTRHSNHKQEIKKQTGGLGQHYGGPTGCGYQNLSMQIIDQVDLGDKEALANLEVYWQNQLRCFVENGGNGHVIRKEKPKYLKR